MAWVPPTSKLLKPLIVDYQLLIGERTLLIINWHCYVVL